MKQNIIEIRTFQEETGLEDDNLMELYMAFSEEIQKEKENVKLFYHIENIQGMIKTIHKIKGLSGNYRANKVYEISKEIEKILKDNNLLKLNYYIQALIELVEETVEEIEEHFCNSNIN
ncbi:Hpt domain-containing protein [Mobilitalea sibirica]|uniref:Hpt domain-containing protein n=1 Tax=Mobilitalea sibirica TaxID=1462919 RepID=A0A8J7HA38_9FIRM|nr:Hpt domain-containing protein [Mobilitalea sibirica]MBH1939581.1 Hpt domain-containing protein [Mobilitalea sibirica]